MQAVAAEARPAAGVRGQGAGAAIGRQAQKRNGGHCQHCMHPPPMRNGAPAKPGIVAPRPRPQTPT